jgi:4-nitrophenyl phosphatase
MTHPPQGIRGFVLDMDGVLWRGESLMPGARRFFEAAQAHEWGVVLATNNPSESPEGFAIKARALGLPVEPEQVVTSATATQQYLLANYREGTELHVIGPRNLKQTLGRAGFEVVRSANADVVVVAMARDICYADIEAATLSIWRGAAFVGTNADAYYPSEIGFLPGSGTMVAAIEASTNRRALIMGKPEPEIFHSALKILDLPASSVACVGDRLDTDIAGGRNAGLVSILLTTGVADQAQLAKASIVPDYVFNDLAEMLQTFIGE